MYPSEAVSERASSHAQVDSPSAANQVSPGIGHAVNTQAF